MNRLKGKMALITGATSGIGKATAELLSESGCNLILTGRRQDRLKTLSQTLSTEFGVEVHAASFDITDLEACKLFAEDFADQDIDILVNNAGLAKGVDSVQNTDAHGIYICSLKKVLVSIEENLSIIYKKWLFEPINVFFQDFSSMFQIFRKILEIWNNSVKT